jgi:hypothetical protein
MSECEIPVSQLLQFHRRRQRYCQRDQLPPRSVFIAIVVDSVNVCSINSSFAASSARRRRQQRHCQRGEFPSRSCSSTESMSECEIPVSQLLQFHRRRQRYCQRDQLPPRSVFIAIVVYSVNDCMINSNFAASAASTSSTESRLAAFRRRRQCQRGQAPSRSFYITIAVVVVSVNVCSINSRFAAFSARRRRQQRQCQRDEFPFCSSSSTASMSAWSSPVSQLLHFHRHRQRQYQRVEFPVSQLLQFHRRCQRHCQRSSPASQRFHRHRSRLQRQCLLDQFQFRSFFSVVVVNSVNVRVLKFHLAAASIPAISGARSPKVPENGTATSFGN